MTTWQDMDRNGPDVYGTSYVINYGRKREVSIRKALQDLKFHGNSSILDRLIVPRKIESSILEKGNIVVGQSPDSQYLGCVRQTIEDSTYRITNHLTRFVPEFSSLNLPTVSAKSVLSRVAFCMSPRSELAIFMNNYEISIINFQIYSLNHNISLSLRMKSSDCYTVPSLRYICATDNQVLLSFPLSKPNMMCPFHIFLMTEIPEDLAEGKDRTIMRIHNSYITGSAAALRYTRHDALSVYKNGESLKFFQTRQKVNAELFIVIHTPDVPSAVFGALIKHYPQFAHIEFERCLGGVKRFSDTGSIYNVYASFFYQNKECFVFSTATAPSPLVLIKDIHIKIHWVKSFTDLSARKMQVFVLSNLVILVISGCIGIYEPK